MKKGKKIGTISSKIGKPKKAFTAIIKEAKNAINFSIASDTQKDDEGNDVVFYLWVNGDWNIEYKGKEYIIPLNENITALIGWINSQEKK